MPPVLVHDWALAWSPSDDEVAAPCATGGSGRIFSGAAPQSTEDVHSIIAAIRAAARGPPASRGAGRVKNELEEDNAGLECLFLHVTTPTAAAPATGLQAAPRTARRFRVGDVLEMRFGNDWYEGAVRFPG